MDPKREKEAEDALSQPNQSELKKRRSTDLVWARSTIPSPVMGELIDRLSAYFLSCDTNEVGHLQIFDEFQYPVCDKSILREIEISKEQISLWIKSLRSSSRDLTCESLIWGFSYFLKIRKRLVINFRTYRRILLSIFSFSSKIVAEERVWLIDFGSSAPLCSKKDFSRLELAIMQLLSYEFDVSLKEYAEAFFVLFSESP